MGGFGFGIYIYIYIYISRSLQAFQAAVREVLSKDKLESGGNEKKHVVFLPSIT